jgi:hypothetical protein
MSAQSLQLLASDCHLSSAYGCIGERKSVRVPFSVLCCAMRCGAVRCLEVYGPSILALTLPLGPFLGLRGPRGPQAGFPWVQVCRGRKPVKPVVTRPDEALVDFRTQRSQVT